MKIEKTRDNCIERLNTLMRLANLRGNEFDGKGYNSLKSVVLQISQSPCLSPRNKLILMLDVVIKAEEFAQ